MRTNWCGWPLCLSEALTALVDGRRRCWRAPVVALESTLITHGLPYPENLELIDQVQAIIRRGGAYPAVMVIINGVVWVDPSATTLKRVAVEGARTFLKCNRRDLSVAVAGSWNASLTVSAVMEIAHGLGIRVFVTGGIGGVHRDFARSHDVSADLTALARIPVCVVCAGIKSVLDIGATLERLETESVPVVVVGSEEFPAFWCRRSGYAAPVRLDTAEQVATVLRLHLHPLMTTTHERKGNPSGASERMPGGMLVAVPIPAADECPDVETAVQRALSEAAQESIRGKALTPYLLERVATFTQGASLRANMALLRHNASFGTELASALHRIEKGMSLGTALLLPPNTVASMHRFESEQKHSVESFTKLSFADNFPEAAHSARHHDDVSMGSLAHKASPQAPTAETEQEYDQTDRDREKRMDDLSRTWLPLNVVGQWALDIHAFCDEPTSSETCAGATRVSNPGRVSCAYGGVAYNIALTLSHLAGDGSSPHFFSNAMADVHLRSSSLHPTTEAGDTPIQWMRRAPQPTAVYVAVHDRDRELLVAVFDGKNIEPDALRNLDPSLPTVWDANLSPEAMAMLPQSTCFWFEPTSAAKAGRIVTAGRLSALPWMSPNELELVAIANAAGHAGSCVDTEPSALSDAQIDDAAEYLIRQERVQNILVTRGARGVTWFRASATTARGIERRHFPARTLSKAQVRSTTGAGDVFAAAVIFALLCQRAETPEQAIHFGLEAASIACQYETAVPPARALQRLIRPSVWHRL
ncbi:hypothetical protein CCYA_CCYA13G3561 [Cyanidiococcus yangmingshanensis]|nr:hypothetical protein CCYA_CCYA13G3561 [Cyanidiococcus yangmingshanensis]